MGVKILQKCGDVKSDPENDVFLKQLVQNLLICSPPPFRPKQTMHPKVIPAYAMQCIGLSISRKLIIII